MTMKPQGAVIFADDTREEVGGKFSIMGLLGPECWVTDRETSLVCMFLYWAVDSELTITAEFETKNAPEGMKLPSSIERTLRRHVDDKADRWLIQMTGRLNAKVGDKPLEILVTFRVGEEAYYNKIVMEYDHTKTAETKVVSQNENR